MHAQPIRLPGVDPLDSCTGKRFIARKSEAKIRGAWPAHDATVGRSGLIQGFGSSAPQTFIGLDHWPSVGVTGLTEYWRGGKQASQICSLGLKTSTSRAEHPSLYGLVHPLPQRSGLLVVQMRETLFFLSLSLRIYGDRLMLA